jgi:uncharacterized membrane protein
MEEVFTMYAETVELLLEAVLVTLIAIGGVVTVYRVFLSIGKSDPVKDRRKAWVGFAGWLLLALEFALAADLVATAVSPSWDDIGQLAVIALIRTFLGYFLERDIESLREGGMGTEGAKT